MTCIFYVRKYQRNYVEFMYQSNAAGSITICCYDKQHVRKHSDSKSKYINRTTKELNLKSGLLLNVKLQNVVFHH